ncbi:MAG: glycosyltransferase family 4 protein [Tannerellaceae bacterium]|jgi:glycosyltransferase involved in cell wall biosynthesis|nr:glycosyltransferase family 4 protein [Tannerellaceae bacterium]
MNIGFDAKRAVQNNTGLGNYSRYVIEILSEYYPENRYVLFAPRRRHNAGLRTILSRENISFVFPAGIYKLFASLWRTLGIRKDVRGKGLDLYHGLSNELPLGIAGVKTVVTVHDLIFIRHPRYYNAADRIIYRLKLRHACRTADVIIATSECTKRDIVSFFHIPPQKIKVVYQGCHPMFGESVTEERRKDVACKYSLPQRFLLNVGTIEERKNLMIIVKAMTNIPEDVHLVAIGKSTRYRQQVERYAEKSGTAPRLHILDNVTSDDLPAIYRMAEVFIYPSFFEGFGIPVVEALTSGLPVIAATGSCLEEAGGPGSIYVDPYDEAGLSEQLISLLDDKERMKRMAADGREYTKRFSGERIASDLMSVYSI